MDNFPAPKSQSRCPKTARAAKKFSRTSREIDGRFEKKTFADNQITVSISMDALTDEINQNKDLGKMTDTKAGFLLFLGVVLNFFMFVPKVQCMNQYEQKVIYKIPVGETKCDDWGLDANDNLYIYSWYKNEITVKKYSVNQINPQVFVVDQIKHNDSTSLEKIGLFPKELYSLAVNDDGDFILYPQSAYNSLFLYSTDGSFLKSIKIDKFGIEKNFYFHNGSFYSQMSKDIYFKKSENNFPEKQDIKVDEDIVAHKLVIKSGNTINEIPDNYLDFSFSKYVVDDFGNVYAEYSKCLWGESAQIDHAKPMSVKGVVLEFNKNGSLLFKWEDFTFYWETKPQADDVDYGMFDDFKIGLSTQTFYQKKFIKGQYWFIKWTK